MVLLFILLGILQGYAHSSAKTPSSVVLTNMNNRTTKLRDWLIYLLSLLTKVFGPHSEFIQKLLGLVDKTTSVSLTFHLT
ncbi:unnamed protein product [Schistosoma intercalatum]|nr:unnamed protein product [Schistosoma intercalatum]CAH8578604.1 unnamed protein product [Schistosoma intercalatum]